MMDKSVCQGYRLEIVGPWHGWWGKYNIIPPLLRGQWCWCVQREVLEVCWIIIISGGGPRWLWCGKNKTTTIKVTHKATTHWLFCGHMCLCCRCDYNCCYLLLLLYYKGGCEVIHIYNKINMKTRVFDTNRRNKGLISVDRRTSLLSYLQYLVPYQSRLQRIYHSQWPIDD